MAALSCLIKETIIPNSVYPHLNVNNLLISDFGNYLKGNGPGFERREGGNGMQRKKLKEEGGEVHGREKCCGQGVGGVCEDVESEGNSWRKKGYGKGSDPAALTLLTAGRSIFLNQGSEDVPSQLKTLPGFHLLINKVLSLKKRR